VPAYRVTAPYVTFRSESTSAQVPRGFVNAAVASLHEGATMPEDAHPGDVAHLLRKGLIEAEPEET
jgi:hypothetical protein